MISAIACSGSSDGEVDDEVALSPLDDVVDDQRGAVRRYCSSSPIMRGVKPLLTSRR